MDLGTTDGDKISTIVEDTTATPTGMEDTLALILTGLDTGTGACMGGERTTGAPTPSQVTQIRSVRETLTDLAKKMKELLMIKLQFKWTSNQWRKLLRLRPTHTKKKLNSRKSKLTINL